MKISIEEISKMLKDVAMKYGLSEEDAKIVTEEYVNGELQGRNCHGIAAFLTFGKKIKEISKDEPVVENEAGSYMIINGKQGLGPLVCNKFVPIAIERVRKNGIFLLGMHNMYSYLMPGTWARKIAEQGLIAFVCNYGGTPRMAPYGGIDPVFATNPIAYGIPGKPNIVLDMATSKRAFGLVRLCDKLGQKLPEGMAIDKDGKPTTDPSEALKGAVLPFGSYKGSGIALFVEVLARVVYNIQYEPGKLCRGYTFILIDPKLFGPIENFEKNVEDLRQQIKKSRKADGVDEILLPDEDSERTRQEILKRGYFEIDEKIINGIKKMLKD